MKIQLTRNEWEDIFECPPEDILRREEEPGKHDSRYNTIVFKRDGKIFETTYLSSYEWGVDDYQFPLTAYEVTPVEKVIIDYVRVSND